MSGRQSIILPDNNPTFSSKSKNQKRLSEKNQAASFIQEFIWITSISGELFDIVEYADLVIGQGLRTVVHARGLQHRGNHIFLVTPGNKLVS
jgi:hypothetical protein